MNKNIPPEDLPQRETTGAFRRFGYDAKKYKHSHNFWSICCNFLDSKLGHNWDKVYSHICSYHEDKDKARMFKFMKEHIELFVDFNVTEENGILFYSNGRKLSTYGTIYYLKKGEKILRKFEQHYRCKKPKKKFIQIDGRNFIKIEGVWYEFSYKRFEPIYPYKDCYDCILKKRVDRSETYALYGLNIVAYYKVQLSSKEIKRLGLNDK